MRGERSDERNVPATAEVERPLGDPAPRGERETLDLQEGDPLELGQRTWLVSTCSRSGTIMNSDVQPFAFRYKVEQPGVFRVLQSNEPQIDPVFADEGRGVRHGAQIARPGQRWMAGRRPVARSSRRP